MKEESEKAGLKQHSKNKDHGIQSHHFMENSWGKRETGNRFHSLGLQSHCRYHFASKNYGFISVMY